MKILNTDLSPLNVADQSGRQQAPRGGSDSSGDDFHLSELVRSLRALVADSPERQERIEQITRAYANGTYKVETEGTAGKIIDDGLEYR